ncbi:MAG: hypothetical protein N4A50_03075 [Vallitalea sp.]|nr:hypothetical protein [Vallitalea sp.]
MNEYKNDNIWLYKSSIIFIDKLLRDNMISRQEYNTTKKKLKEVYKILPISYPCENT